MSRLYPKPIYFSVEDAAGELVAEYLDRAEALALAKQHDGVVYAHGRCEGATRNVFWEVSL
ncbi:MAG TPA: hypothetical protein VK524_10925 [Polyangiaceae bacterium]|nr:hypothetical protein [Polyangiaceae bacterium]